MALLRLLGLTVAFWASGVTADINTDIPYPYNCSTRTLCSEFRMRLPVENKYYNAEYVSISNDSTQATFNLFTKAGDKLVLTIDGVKNQMFRVIIEEENRHRYQLQYSLEKNPALKNITVKSSTDESVVIVDDELNKVIVNLAPLSIEFYHQEVLELVLEGDRIIMEDTSDSQAFTFLVRFASASRLMGLHEHVDNLNLRHTTDYSIDPYRLRNTDYGATEYPLNNTKSMYGSIPVIYGFGNTTAGIFHHNAAEQWIDINLNDKSAYFMVDGGRLDLFVLLGPSLKETVRQYVDLTGKPHLPQLWALGYHQCRWAYNNTNDVKDIIQSFDKYDFPLDVLWLDIEYTSDRKWFTWNATAFEDPVSLLNWVDGQGHRRLVPISDPHIKIDNNYTVYTDLLKNNLFVNSSDGTKPFVAECWPGNSSWVDFLNPDARDYYAKLHLYSNFPSTPALGGFWNDMNEPTLFDNLPERTFPFDVLHYGKVPHRDIHNQYGMLQTMSTHDGLLQRDNKTLRPFILSRAFFAGQQRYSNKWSGDNWGLFEDLRISVPMALTSNLVGLAFYGADIPGFNGQATEELLIRWYQLGIWLPFFRAHAALGSPRREPFRFGNETQTILRDAMGLRYKHLPYWYTLFYEHTSTGDPIVRPLLYQYPEDSTGFDLTDEFLIGGDILTASVYESNQTSVKVYFPGSSEEGWIQVTGNASQYFPGRSWADIDVDITFTPVFYRTGSIISRKPTVKRSTADIKDDPLELHVVLDANNKASGNIYIDDFESFKYTEKKEYAYLKLDYDHTTSSLTTSDIDSDSVSGGFAISVASLTVYSRNTVTKLVADSTGRKLSEVDIIQNSIIF